jgi:hypothetical protein
VLYIYRNDLHNSHILERGRAESGGQRVEGRRQLLFIDIGFKNSGK